VKHSITEKVLNQRMNEFLPSLLAATIRQFEATTLKKIQYLA